jgi:transposase-like protein
MENNKEKEYPMTFREFIKRFPDEEHCRTYLFELRWSNQFCCPKCSHSECWTVNKLLYTCKLCRHQSSVITGTIFQDTRKPLMDWFIGIWWVTTQKNGASAEGLQQVLGLKSYETAWTWLHKIRSAMVVQSREKLSGTVEVDDAYIGGVSEGKRGRGAENKTNIIVAAEIRDKKLGRIRLNVIKDVSGDSLVPFITNNIEAGSSLITDAWSGFSGIEKKGYTRTVYKKSEAVENDEMLPHVHLVISLLKRWLLGTHQGRVEPKHLQAYLDEFVFRFNRRTSAKRGLLFYRLLENAMVTPPLTLDSIISKEPDF